MKTRLVVGLLVLGAVSITLPVSAGWQDWVKEADSYIKSTTGKDSRTVLTSTLSDSQIAEGLKEALDSGVKKAIDTLGKENGFLSDKAVKILMPEQLQKVEQMLRSFGQEKMADEFVISMNRAAEQAVPEVGNVFYDAIKKMSLTDAQGILSGGDTAATDYFKKNTSDQLVQLIKPYVNNAMDTNQVTQSYKMMVSQVKRYDNFGLMDAYLGSASDIDDYVTSKTMDGLFNKIAVQEKLIRDNPAARSTELLKEVFGSVVK
jgi:hypothetical protein